MSLYELVFIARQEVSPVRAKELAAKVSDFVKKKGCFLSIKLLMSWKSQEV